MGKTATPAPRRGRGALLWGAAAFAAAHLLAMAAGEADWAQRDPEFARKLEVLRARVAERPGGPLVLLLGSSRTGCGVRPGRLGGLPAPGGADPVVFNFGMCRGAAVLELLTLRRLLAEGVRPALVLAELWPLWAHENEAETLEPWRLRRGDLAVLRGYHPRPGDLELRWWAEELPPWPLRRVALRHRRGPVLVLGDQALERQWRGLDGWGALWLEPFDVPAAGWEERKRLALPRFVPLLGALPIDPSVDGAVRELLALCRREGIAAWVVLHPDGLQPDYAPGAAELVDGYLDRLQRDTGAGVIDLRGWSAPGDFYEGVHRTYAGADRFTDRLGREVLAPLLAGERPAGYRPPG
jgi:hypothetical protein